LAERGGNTGNRMEKRKVASHRPESVEKKWSVLGGVSAFEKGFSSKEGGGQETDAKDQKPLLLKVAYEDGGSYPMKRRGSCVERQG